MYVDDIHSYFRFIGKCYFLSLPIGGWGFLVLGCADVDERHTEEQ